MAEKEDGGLKLCRRLCAVCDELRNSWLSRQSRGDFRAILSLTISQQRMVRTLWNMMADHPQGVMLRELAEKLMLSCGAVSAMVEGMVRKEIMERVTSPADRRKVLIRLSATGWQRARIYESFFEEICSGLPEAQDPEKMKIINGFFDHIISQINHNQEDETK